MPGVNKIGKVIGFVGGAIAILWAMRDRLVSIAAPQDPEPPRFRVVPPSPAPPAAEDDLTDDQWDRTGVRRATARRRDLHVPQMSPPPDPLETRRVTGAAETRAADWVSAASARV
jgi:hypothetical protein